MDKEYWLNKWQKNDIPFHEENVTSGLVLFFNTLGLSDVDTVFVPLCGKSRDVEWLASQGLHVIGIEASPIACREFFTERNITPQIVKYNNFDIYQQGNIKILCGDLFDLQAGDIPPIQAVYDCKALIALPPEIRQKYVDHIFSCVGTDVKILLLTRESPCRINPPPWPVTLAEVNSLYGKNFRINVLDRSIVKNIPERCIEKGYEKMTNVVYMMLPK